MTPLCFVNCLIARFASHFKASLMTHKPIILLTKYIQCVYRKKKYIFYFYIQILVESQLLPLCLIVGFENNHTGFQYQNSKKASINSVNLRFKTDGSGFSDFSCFGGCGKALQHYFWKCHLKVLATCYV